MMVDAMVVTPLRPQSRPRGRKVFKLRIDETREDDGADGLEDISRKREERSLPAEHATHVGHAGIAVSEGVGGLMGKRMGDDISREDHAEQVSDRYASDALHRLPLDVTRNDSSRDSIIQVRTNRAYEMR